MPVNLPTSTSPDMLGKLHPTKEFSLRILSHPQPKAICTAKSAALVAAWVSELSCRAGNLIPSGGKCTLCGRSVESGVKRSVEYEEWREEECGAEHNQVTGEAQALLRITGGLLGPCWPPSMLAGTQCVSLSPAV